MRFTFKQQYLVGKTEEFPTYTKYTLLSFGDFDKVVFITQKGKFGTFEYNEKVEATIDINIKTERLKLQGNSQDQYKDIARIFLVDLTKMDS